MPCGHHFHSLTDLHVCTAREHVVCSFHILARNKALHEYSGLRCVLHTQIVHQSLSPSSRTFAFLNMRTALQWCSLSLSVCIHCLHFNTWGQYPNKHELSARSGQIRGPAPWVRSLRLPRVWHYGHTDPAPSSSTPSPASGWRTENPPPCGADTSGPPTTVNIHLTIHNTDNT